MLFGGEDFQHQEPLAKPMWKWKKWLQTEAGRVHVHRRSSWNFELPMKILISVTDWGTDEEEADSHLWRKLCLFLMGSKDHEVLLRMPAGLLPWGFSVPSNNLWEACLWNYSIYAKTSTTWYFFTLKADEKQIFFPKKLRLLGLLLTGRAGGTAGWLSGK